MKRCTWIYKPDNEKVQKVLTGRFSLIVPTVFLTNYFTMLWREIFVNVHNYIEGNSELQSLGVSSVWDVVRFTLKGGTSILQAINFILELSGESDADIEKIRDDWAKSDWDSTLVINPALPTNIYFKVLEICYAQLFSVSAMFKPDFDKYLDENRQMYTFILPRQDIESIYPPKKYLQDLLKKYPAEEAAVKATEKAAAIVATIASIVAIPIKGEAHFYRDYARDRAFINKASADRTWSGDWKNEENQFSVQLMNWYKDRHQSMRVKEHKVQKFYDQSDDFYALGLTKVINSKSNNSYVQEAVIRDLKHDFTGPGREFNYHFDLYRLIVPYKLVLTDTKGNICETSPFMSELVDVSILFQESQENPQENFDKLNLENMLPVTDLPIEKYKYFKKTYNYPIVGLEYNINDLIAVMNETGKENPKHEKRCKRALALMKIKCKTENYYKPPSIPYEICPIPEELNDTTCKDQFQVDWTDCNDVISGEPLTKRKLIELLGILVNNTISEETLMMFKKQYLCHIYRRFYYWTLKYPAIENQLKQLMVQIFFVLFKELELHPRLVNPVVELPSNLLDVLLYRNVFIDFEFRNFLFDVKEPFVKRLGETYFEIEKKLNPNQFEGIYIVGGSAYTLLHSYIIYDLLSSRAPQEVVKRLEGPYKSFDFDSELYASVHYHELIQSEIFREIVKFIADNIKISNTDALLINAKSARFVLVHTDSLDKDNLKDKWYWKYLSNLNIPNEEPIDQGSDYTFLSLEKRPAVNAVIVRVNVIIYDKQYDIYRMEHLVELMIRCGPQLPNLQEGSEFQQKVTDPDGNINPNAIGSQYWLRDPRTNLKFANPSHLFSLNYESMKERAERSNIKWIVDRNRLEYLCKMTSLYKEYFQEDIILPSMVDKCKEIINSKDESTRVYNLQKEYMIEFIREYERDKAAEEFRGREMGLSF